MRTVLDTSALSAVMHRLPEAIDRLFGRDPADLVLCAPTIAEVEFGLARLPAASRRHRLLSAELALVRGVVPFCPWDEAAAVRFGAVKAALEGAGLRIDDMDVAIAAIALELGAAVATCHVRHFDRIGGLVVEDWSC